MSVSGGGKVKLIQWEFPMFIGAVLRAITT